MAYIINGELIGDEVLEEEFDAIKDHYASLGEVVCCDRDEEFMGFARENIVNRTLLTQEADKRFGPPKDEDVDQMIAQLKEEHGGEKAFYDNTGFNPGDEPRIKEKVRATIGVDQLLETEIGPDPEPTDAELQAHYEATIERYLTEEEVRISQIFKEPTSHEDAKVRYQELKEARFRILDGADFLEVAKETSDKPAEEIDLGFLKMGETMPEIESIAFSMREGEVSPIVATHFGFHLFQVTDRKAAAPVPFDEVIDTVREHFLTHSRESAINALISRLKETATIEEVTAEPEAVTGEV
ncbi:MAG: peptidyl-prolyl cis-trans isomerase [Verrucomicrobiae bacterium]|nr:peptidyl-prolyl cis-trans isomerase [Verrucomicrobiae bacterium]